MSHNRQIPAKLHLFFYLLAHIFLNLIRLFASNQNSSPFLDSRNKTSRYCLRHKSFLVRNFVNATCFAIGLNHCCEYSVVCECSVWKIYLKAENFVTRSTQQTHKMVKTELLKVLKQLLASFAFLWKCLTNKCYVFAWFAVIRREISIRVLTNHFSWYSFSCRVNFNF